MKKLLVICGVSGSGKSTLERNLILDYSNIFHKWQQVTTRKMRPNGERFGDPYIFVQPDTFSHLQDKLVGRVGLAEDTIFKDKYGSIPDFVDNKISTVILSTEGINDLIDAIETKRVDIDKVFIIGLDVNFEDLNADTIREGRPKEFVDQERDVLDHANFIFRTNNGRYLSPKSVMHILEDYNFIESVEV